MPGVKQGRGGTPFLDRELRRGKSQQQLIDLPQPGGVGQKAPQGVGGTNVRPNQPPSAEPAGTPAPTPRAADTTLARTPARPRGTTEPESRFMSIPTVDEEFPVSDLVGAGGQGANIAATSLGERFYRRYGRYPTETDLSIINLRRRFERDQGRPPTRDELLAALRNNMIVNREDELLG